MKSINVNMVLKTQMEKSDVPIETFGYSLHLWEISSHLCFYCDAGFEAKKIGNRQ